MEPGQRIRIFVDPKTNQAEDDLRPMTHFLVALGVMGGTLVFFLGFFVTGKVLHTLR